MDARERRTLWLMAAPFLAGVAVLVVGPVALALVMAAFEWDLVTAPAFVGLANVRALLDDAVFPIALGNSLRYAAIAVPLRAAAAVALAALLRPRAVGTGVGRAAVFVPSAVPDVAVAVVWLWILNPLHGPLNLALAAVGLPTPAWLTEASSARWAIVLMGLFQLGEGFAIALAARAAVPRELEETAAAAGAGPVATFWRVVLPAMAPALLLLAARDTVASLQTTFVPALVVTGGGPPPHATTYLPVFVYREAFEYLRFGTASAATVVMLAVTASALWLQYAALRRIRSAWLPWRTPSDAGR
jgi:multiple sugar transport system permease protein